MEETEKVMQAWRIKSEMRDVAARALYDQTLKKEFFANMPHPALAALQSLGPTNALKLLLTVTKAETRAFPCTVGEAIGLQYWDGQQTWEMTEADWALKA